MKVYIQKLNRPHPRTQQKQANVCKVREEKVVGEGRCVCVVEGTGKGMVEEGQGKKGKEEGDRAGGQEGRQQYKGVVGRHCGMFTVKRQGSKGKGMCMAGSCHVVVTELMGRHRIMAGNGITRHRQRQGHKITTTHNNRNPKKEGNVCVQSVQKKCM